jgi:hypothetical protein
MMHPVKFGPLTPSECIVWVSRMSFVVSEQDFREPIDGAA